jgi:hypothetical protein
MFRKGGAAWGAAGASVAPAQTVLTPIGSSDGIVPSGVITPPPKSSLSLVRFAQKQQQRRSAGGGAGVISAGVDAEAESESGDTHSDTHSNTHSDSHTAGSLQSGGVAGASGSEGDNDAAAIARQYGAVERGHATAERRADERLLQTVSNIVQGTASPEVAAPQYCCTPTSAAGLATCRLGANVQLRDVYVPAVGGCVCAPAMLVGCGYDWPCRGWVGGCVGVACCGLLLCRSF